LNSIPLPRLSSSSPWIPSPYASQLPDLYGRFQAFSLPRRAVQYRLNRRAACLDPWLPTAETGKSLRAPSSWSRSIASAPAPSSCSGSISHEGRTDRSYWRLPWRRCFHGADELLLVAKHSCALLGRFHLLGSARCVCMARRDDLCWTCRSHQHVLMSVILGS